MTSEACPELGALEQAPLPPSIEVHVQHCTPCRLVVDVFAELAALRSPGDNDDCPRFDALLAARADGTLNRAGANLLQRHLSGCAACREVADTLSPIADARGDLASLPRVDPAAYALGLEIARGGMGRILAARDLRVGRPVAVKELLGRSPRLAARFEREARVTARLQHPGILPIYEIGQWPDGTPFYAMRMVDGRTLLEAISSAPKLHARLALLPAMIAACEAIAFAHGQRVIHRDLTPSNVLVGAYGETVVIDWGLAKDLSDASRDLPDEAADRPPDDSAERLTEVGAVIGTAAYMPPEQAHAQPVDEHADVYALGAILYHLLAGAPPYAGPTTREVLRAVKVGPPRAIDQAAPGAPGDLLSIVAKAMARDPEARYPSARELADELKRFQTGRMVAAHAYSTAEHVARFVRRNRAAVVVTTLAALVLGGFAALAGARIVRSGAEARRNVVELLVEQGRTEYVAGNPLRALAYLNQAWAAGVRSPALEFLIDSAAKNLWKTSAALDCGSDARSLDFSPDNLHVAIACHDRAQIFSLAAPDAPPVALGTRTPGGFDDVGYTHDGATIATWGAEGVVRLWDPAGGIRLELAHGAGITHVSFTPDDQRLATTGFDGTAKLWDARTGALLRTIVVTSSPMFRRVYGMISANGKHLLTTTFEGEGKGWELATGALIGEIDHGGFVFAGEPSPDGRLSATCGMDGLAKVWDVSQTAPRLVLTLGGHTDMLWKCVFDPSSTRLLTASHDGRANVWDLRDGSLITSVVHGEVVLAAHFSADGRRFMTVGLDGFVRLWDTGSGARLASHQTFGGKDAGFSRDGSRVVALRGDGRIQIWDETDPLLATYARPPGGSLAGISEDGASAAIERPDGWIEIYDTVTHHRLAHPPLHAPIVVAGPRFAAATPTGALVLDTTTGDTRALPLPAPPRALALSNDGGRLAIVPPAGPIEVWSTAPPTRVRQLDVGRHVALDHDGHAALTWRDGQPPTVWDLDAGTSCQLAIIRPYAPIGFAFDGQRVAVVELVDDTTHVVSLWTATGVPIRSIVDVSVAPAFDTSGRWLTTIGVDHVVSVWDVADGARVSSFLSQDLQQAQVDADRALLVAIGEHGTAAMVLSADGRTLARWPLEHPRPVVGDSGVTSPRGLAWWSSTGRAVSQSTNVAVWNRAFDHALHPIASLVATHVPWRVDHGQLAWIKVRFRGHIVHAHPDHTPAIGIAGAKISVELRTSAYVGASLLSWRNLEARVETIAVADQPDDDGRFAIDDLFPGRYTFTITAGDQVTRLPVTIDADRTDYELSVPD